jgi:hypothetical protein
MSIGEQEAKKVANDLGIVVSKGQLVSDGSPVWVARYNGRSYWSISATQAINSAVLGSK